MLQSDFSVLEQSELLLFNGLFAGTGLRDGGLLERYECQSGTHAFEDESFDVVITSDVMEHVRRDHLAHAEIHRCLKRFGHYIFTVPFVPQWEKNQIRDDSSGTQDVALMENEYHGDPVSGKGILVYRIYGNELIEQLKDLGFEVKFDGQPNNHGGMPTKDLFILSQAVMSVLVVTKGNCFQESSWRQTKALES